MNYLYVDFETTYNTTDLSLKKMTLRNYLNATSVKGLAAAENDDDPVYFTARDLENPEVLNYLRTIAESDEWTVAAHNAAFDLRVWRYKTNLPYPKHKLCSLELACAAYPGQPGGYSLFNLARTLDLGGTKIEIDLNEGRHTPEELAAYCIGDVTLCRNLTRKCLPRLCPEEIKIAEMCNDARELFFLVDTERVVQSVQDLSATATAHAASAVGLGDNDAFGWDGDVGMSAVRSVKPQAVKKALLENLGFDTKSISFKKINREKLRENPAATSALKAVERTSKTLSHKRSVGKFIGASVIDVELGYFRAHTGRFSSPQVGGSKGINIHNLPKRDKALAKAVRTLFRLPSEYCFVRADLANVEYRIEGWLTNCDHVARMFGRDVLTDPYAAFWFAATGQRCSKTENTAARQLAKAAVLGLGYGMGLARWIDELGRGLADPSFNVTMADLESICESNGWRVPADRYIRSIQRRTGAPDTIVAVAYHTREQFHRLHPEFSRTASWIEQAVVSAVRGLDGQVALDNFTEQSACPPDISHLGLVYDGSKYGPGVKTIRATCGLWPQPTVTWRDLCFKETSLGGYCLHCIHSVKGYRPLTKTVMIENVTQSAARNALCRGQLRLRQLGYIYQLSVHDEIMLVVPKNTAAVLRAKADLLTVFGPGNTLGYDWAVIIDPSEITVSQSLYETPTKWDNLDLEHLP